jgi:glycosyltransferase involved in cell wall biosynthesis
MVSKISLFSGIYPPETGGPAKFAETFSNFLRRIGHDVQVIAYSSRPGRNQNLILLPNNISVFRKYTQMVNLILKEARTGNVILANGSFWEIGMARMIKKFDYVAKIPGDIVWERARNQMLTTKSIDSFQNERLTPSLIILRKLFLFTLKNARWVIVPSEHLGSLCIAWGIPKEKVVHIKNSVTVPVFPELNSKVKEFDFVTVCRLVSWKGVEEIIQSASKLDASLLIIGDGPERSRLETIARDLRVRALFLGEIPQEEIPRQLSICKTFVLNSNFEATSYALLEAQANGILTIANEETGSEEVIIHLENGILCGNQSGFDLTGAMFFAMTQGDSVRLMTKNAYKSVSSNFNTEINYKKILELCTS